MSQESDFTKGPITGPLLKFALPILPFGGLAAVMLAAAANCRVLLILYMSVRQDPYLFCFGAGDFGAPRLVILALGGKAFSSI